MLKIALVMVGDQIVLTVDSHPTALMVQLNADEADKLARGLDTATARIRQSLAAATLDEEQLS